MTDFFFPNLSKTFQKNISDSCLSLLKPASHLFFLEGLLSDEESYNQFVAHLRLTWQSRTNFLGVSTRRDLCVCPENLDLSLAGNWLAWMQTLYHYSHLDSGAPLNKAERMLANLNKLVDTACPCQAVACGHPEVVRVVKSREKKAKGLFLGSVLLAQLVDNRGVSFFSLFFSVTIN